jgi:hypothetical protein
MVKSDGNGGTIIKAKPGAVALFSLMFTLLISAISFAFGQGKQSKQIENMQEYGLENRKLITALSGDYQKSCLSIEKIKTDVEWMRDAIEKMD